MVVRPKRHRYSSHRQGFHEDFTRPQSAHYESDIKSSWVDVPEKCPSMSQDLADAFSIPVNTLEAITGLRKPERPSRSRSNRSVNILADQTPTFPEYENTMYDVPPRRIKRLSKSPVSRPDWNQTWPRKDVSADKPAAPKRAKPQKPSAGSEYPTWPRRSPKSSPPPLAPKRARSKNQIDVEEQIVVSESEPVVPMETEEIKLNIPVERAEVEPVAEAEEVKIVNTEVAEEVKMTNIEVAVEAVVETQLTEVEVVEADANEEGEPFVPKRRRTLTDLNLSEPPVPVRSKRSSPRPSESEGLEVEKSMQGIAEPASTPSEIHAPQDVVVNEQVMQGLDQLLEILATQQSERSPAEETAEKTELVDEEEIDESGYAEIKQFQNKTPPPRPPPPSAYNPASEPSDQSPYSYIYTVPRRKAKYQTISSSPERPPRTYCTIRPHRPPRKTRTQTTDTNHLTPEDGETVRRHSFSSSDEQTRTERDLQSAPVVERMRTRPLPAPPRTKRRNSNQPPPKDEETTAAVAAVLDVPAAEQVEEHVVPVTETVPVPIQSTDEYEPIETKAEVEEVSIGIQTDPVPEDEEVVVEVNLSAASEAADLISDQPAPEAEPEPAPEAEPEPAPEEMDGLVEGKLILGPIEVVIPQLEQIVQVEQVISTPQVLPAEVSSPVEVISPPEVSAPAEVVSPSTDDVVPVETVPPPAEVSPPVEPPPSEVVVDVVCPPEVTSTPTEVECPQAETASVPVDVVCPPQIVSSAPEVECQPAEAIVVECPTTVVATPPEVTCSPVDVTSAPVEVVSAAPEVVCQPAEVIASVEVECPTVVAPPEVACHPAEVVSAPVEPVCPPAEVASPPVEVVRPPSPIAPPTVPAEEFVPPPVSPPVAPPRQEAKHTKTKANLKEEDDDELDSYSRIPPNFPLPPVRLQLSALDVDRLNVREVQADRLVVSSFDTNTLQVSDWVNCVILSRYHFYYLGIATDVHFQRRTAHGLQLTGRKYFHTGIVQCSV